MEPLPKDRFPSSIATARLRLRKPERREEELYASQALAAYRTRDEPLSLERARAFGTFMLEHWERYGFGFLVIERAGATGQPVPLGHAGFKYVGTWPGHWGERFDAIELGYSIVPEARGHGYVTEAARAALAAAFAAFDLPSISARCDRTNPKSAAVMVRCGMSEVAHTPGERKFVISRPSA